MNPPNYFDLEPKRGASNENVPLFKQSLLMLPALFRKNRIQYTVVVDDKVYARFKSDNGAHKL